MTLLGFVIGAACVVGGLIVIAAGLSRCPHCRGYHAGEAEQEACAREHGKS